VSFFDFGSAIGFAENPLSIQFDSKAMRKVNADQDMVIVKETSAISLGAVAMHAGRFLIKLH